MEGVGIYMDREQKEKVIKYRILNEMVREGQILFTGSSLMEQFPIHELQMDMGISKIIYNRGIGGFTTDDMLQCMEEQIFGTHPGKIFINIGTNDISNPKEAFPSLLAHMIDSYERILRQVQDRLPEAEVYLMAFYPVNSIDMRPNRPVEETVFFNRNNQTIPVANEAVEKLAQKFHYQYIDVNAGLTDERGMLKKEYTVEGIHMYANAYKLVLENMKKYL